MNRGFWGFGEDRPCAVAGCGLRRAAIVAAERRGRVVGVRWWQAVVLLVICGRVSRCWFGAMWRLACRGVRICRAPGERWCSGCVFVVWRWGQCQRFSLLARRLGMVRLRRVGLSGGLEPSEFVAAGPAGVVGVAEGAGSGRREGGVANRL